MDKRRNPDVQKAMVKVRKICQPHCQEYEAFFWPEQFKGIDDYLYYQQKKNAFTVIQGGANNQYEMAA